MKDEKYYKVSKDFLKLALTGGLNKMSEDEADKFIAKSKSPLPQTNEVNSLWAVVKELYQYLAIEYNFCGRIPEKDREEITRVTNKIIAYLLPQTDDERVEIVVEELEEEFKWYQIISSKNKTELEYRQANNVFHKIAHSLLKKLNIPKQNELNRDEVKKLIDEHMTVDGMSIAHGMGTKDNPAPICFYTEKQVDDFITAILNLYPKPSVSEGEK